MYVHWCVAMVGVIFPQLILELGGVLGAIWSFDLGSINVVINNAPQHLHSLNINYSNLVEKEK